MEKTSGVPSVGVGGKPSPGAAYPTVLRVLAITLLLLAWLPAFPLGLAYGWWVGTLVGLPSAACFTIAYARTRAAGNLAGAAGALATPLIWVALFVALVGGAGMD